MTVTKDLSLLCSFKSKIDEAVSYVPRMPATEKVKAVQFWNLVSEKLQDIVNSNSAAISAAAVKSAENDLEKIHLDVSNSRTINTSNCNISSDFINLSSSYNISNELIEQYHSVDIANSQLLTPETYSIVAESSLNSIASISQLTSLNNSMNSCDRNIADSYITIECLPENNCDTLVLNSCLSAASRTIDSTLEESIKNNDYLPKEITHEETNNTYKTSDDTGAISESTFTVNHSSLVSHNMLLTKDNEKSVDDDDDDVTKLPKKTLLEEKFSDKFQSDLNCDSQENVFLEDSETSEDSVKSDFEAATTKEESSSNSTECAETIVSFVVSSSEEILAKNGLKSDASDVNEKCSANCVGRKCSHVKTYTCSDCSAKFSTKSNLMVHMRRHTGEKPYLCSKCSSSFTTKGNLMRHLKTHTGEKPFECSHCGSKFTEKKSLNVHMRRHTGEKPYECKECGKKFAQSGILRSHMAMHLDQKFHLCEHCGKSFRQKSQLQIHKLRHDNVRRHGCSLCTARFLTKGDLERHMRVHTGERPFVCEICSRTFTRQQSLNEHLNRHYGLRPYVCKYCNRAFTEMSGCYKHMKQHEKAAADGTVVDPSTEPTKLSSDPNFDTNSTSVEILRLNELSRDEHLSETEDKDADEPAPTTTYIVDLIA